jgi:lipoprotein-anchoring transpeptidase ErfK/SrfK
MHMSYSVQQRPRIRPTVLLLLLLLAALPLLNACGGNAQIRQLATANQSKFMKALLHAEQIGIPTAMLRPVLTWQQQLSASSSPFSPFNDQPIDDYYRHLDQSYLQLTSQLDSLVLTSSEQLHSRANHDVANAQSTLKQLQAQGLPAQNFSPRLVQMQGMLQHAQLPKDYILVSGRAQDLLQTLQFMRTTSSHLLALKSLIGLLQSVSLDADAVTAQTAYNLDQQQFPAVSSVAALQMLRARVDAQYLQSSTIMLQAIPLITADRLSTLDAQIKQLPTYHIDDALYQQKLLADRAMVHPHMNIQDYRTFAGKVDADITATQFTVLHAEASQFLQQFHQEAQSWGNAHSYYDAYNGQYYMLDAGYLAQGVGSDLDYAFTQAASVQDIQNVIDQINVELFNLKLMETDANDTTAYDQVHGTDIQALNHYQLQRGQVIIVSLAQQALRLYQDGRLVQAFPVTTGRAELPSPPGVWSIMNRQSPTLFKSSDPPDSPYWYPPTHINYAILFHDGGYFIHDSWWRVNYGPGTQFPHYDAGGDETYAGTGSHGCINLPTDEAGWLYNNTSWNTTVIVY